MSNTVLLTGISGYIGLYCAKELLEQGFHVRGSVRNKNKEQEVINTLQAASIDTTNLSLVELDLTSDSGWDQAAEGCDYIMHVASPFTIANPKNPDDMIRPAVDGSLRALKAAKKAGAKRVILTSSVVAMMGNMKKGSFGPEHWTNTSSPEVSVYFKSKTLAEKAAWDYIESQKDDAPLEMSVINPGGVFGPPLGKNITGQTMTIVDQMLKGKMPMVPNASIPMVDVRDVAKLHVQAMLKPEASGKRIIAAHSAPNSFADVANILQNEGYKGPSTRLAPNFMIKLMSLFDREAKGMIGLLDMNLTADNSEATRLFDWTPYPFKDSVIESAKAVKAITA